MAITPRYVLLFAGGAVVAIAAVAYGVGVFDFSGSGASKLGVTSPTLSGQAGDRRPANGSSGGASTGGVTAGSSGTQGAGVRAETGSKATSGGDKTQQPAPKARDQAKVVTPSFDVVRVQGDGSVVVAGKADPGAIVELLSGAHVLGKAKAGPAGDFAIVLDDPLKPGNYQLVLRATAPDKLVAMSKETAVVSVPERSNGQVLALVETPGQPSRLITVPKVPPVPSGGAAIASVEAQGTARKSAAGNPAATTSQEGRMASAGEKPSAATSAGSSSSKDSVRAQAGTARPKGPVAVDAVEIEGNRIFIAGNAEPGKVVRVYANDVFLGEAAASKAGRFLVEALRKMDVGDYIIRADMVDRDGAKVIARAAVPFQRQAGEKVAAVAPSENSGANGKSAAGNASDGNKFGGGNAPASMPAAQHPAGKTANEASSPANAGQAGSAQASGDVKLPSLAGPIAKSPPTVMGQSLQEADGAVIIRRRDTLWQISRRVYGRGIRYSTIYLANQSEIEDPDLIYPGQVFRVPDKTGEGVTADMKAIGNQATTIPSTTAPKATN